MPASALHTIMLPVRGDGKGDNVLAHAAVLAKRFAARVRVVHCHPKTEDLMPFGVVIPNMLRKQIEEAASRNVDVTREQMTEGFRVLARDLGLADQDHEAGKATARFIEYEGKQVDAVKQFGRLADLICVAQPDRSTKLGFNTLKSALFASGRPVMMCPHLDSVPEDLGRHVAIGWNGSLEASRAATAEDLVRYLELKGVQSNIRAFAPKSGVVGEQLLWETAASGADLLVMGAYHDSYERESLFGGNSQIVVDRAQFPVVMVH